MELHQCFQAAWKQTSIRNSLQKYVRKEWGPKSLKIRWRSYHETK